LFLQFSSFFEIKVVSWRKEKGFGQVEWEMEEIREERRE